MKDMISNVAKEFELYADLLDENHFEIYMSTFPVIRMMSTEYLPINTLEFNKTGYKQLEKMLDNHYLKKTGYTFVLNYDVSGYDYWTKDMKESLSIYLDITVCKNADETNLIMDLRDFIEKFYEKYQKLLDCNSYLRKTR